MMKYRRKLLTGAAAVAAGAAIAATGITAAGAASHPNVTGTENVQIMSTSATSTSQSVIAYGVFTAGGVDHPGNTTDTVVFSNGSFKVTHSKGTGTQSFNPKTCLMMLNLHGTYTISGGTGAYATISGSGTYKLNIIGIGQKSGGVCSKTLPPTTFQQVIRASGPVSLH
jgi:membrane peptidoglycan carboxypeptidase